MNETNYEKLDKRITKIVEYTDDKLRGAEERVDNITNPLHQRIDTESSLRQSADDDLRDKISNLEQQNNYNGSDHNKCPYVIDKKKKAFKKARWSDIVYVIMCLLTMIFVVLEIIYFFYILRYVAELPILSFIGVYTVLLSHLYLLMLFCKHMVKESERAQERLKDLAYDLYKAYDLYEYKKYIGDSHLRKIRLEEQDKFHRGY